MSRPAAIRMIVFSLLACAIIAAAIFLFCTQRGQELKNSDKLREMGHDVRHKVEAHPVIAPFAIVAAYIVLGICGVLPVWWIQVLAGIACGLYWGMLWCDLGAAIGAMSTMVIARWLGADWFQSRVESKMARLRRVDELMGHNGLLVVMAARLCHFPYGLSNYALGLSKVTYRDMLVGTLLGSVPSITLYVGWGALPRFFRDWRQHWPFFAALIALNIVLLSPLAIRYWKPQWFKRVGIE